LDLSRQGRLDSKRSAPTNFGLVLERVRADVGLTNSCRGIGRKRGRSKASIGCLAQARAIEGISGRDRGAVQLKRAELHHRDLAAAIFLVGPGALGGRALGASLGESALRRIVKGVEPLRTFATLLTNNRRVSAYGRGR
jgi:hypothetical protein